MAVYIALGSNLGDRRQNLTQALRLMPPLVRVNAISALYESAPQPPAPPPSYLNAACRVTTELAPQQLLDHLKAIETRLGREPAPRWAPRIIDLDIVLYYGLIVDEPDLKIPHPRLIERNFVLQPLLDIDPDLVHPVTGERLADLLSLVGDGGLERVELAGWPDSPH
jgi:2-amino-4-hydroxy-6-hydroxymethyldihydropteridine diphosphokinase